MRLYIILPLLLALIGCSLADPSIRLTQQAQDTQIAVRATRMAVSGLQTQVILDRQATSTSRAYLGLKVQATAWPTVLSDSFANKINNWPTGEEESELDIISFQIQNGVYHLEATAKDGFIYWTIPDGTSADDFYVSVKAQVITGTHTADYGVVFRCVDEDNYYLFEIDNMSQYALLQLMNGEWNTLIDWTEHPTIAPFERNIIAVIGLGDQFLFFVNDQMVAQFTDSSFTGGSYGTVIGLDEAGDTGVFEFDDFLLRSPNPTSTETP